MNIEASRIGTETIKINGGGVFPEGGGCTWKPINQERQGRFPANILLDETAAQLLDLQSIAGGIHSAGKGRARQEHVGDFGIGEHGERTRMRFDYVKYDASAVSDQEMMKQVCVKLEEMIGAIGRELTLDRCGDTERSRSLALTKLEECYMWIGKAIRDDQIARKYEVLGPF